MRLKIVPESARQAAHPDSPGIGKTTMKLTILHNPRCSKSRKTLELIEAAGIRPRVVRYLSDPPDAAELVRIAGMLGRPLSGLLREKEPEFVAAADSLPLDDEVALARWLHAHPAVIERPIVVDEDNGRAVVGRPPENVFELIAT